MYEPYEVLSDMIEYFYTSGDSFAFGQELGYPRLQTRDVYDFTLYHRKKCYSGIMANTISGLKQYVNKALPGGSNERAYRKTITNITQALEKYSPEKIFVNISLTHAYRREFYIGTDWFPFMYTFPPGDTSSDLYKLWELFINIVKDNKGIYMSDMLHVLGVQHFLMKNKIPYLLTSSMGNEYEKMITTESVPASVVNQIYKPRYYDDISFSQFTNMHGFKIGPQLHPLEEAHKAWAHHLLDHINKNDLFSNKDLL